MGVSYTRMHIIHGKIQYQTIQGQLLKRLGHEQISAANSRGKKLPISSHNCGTMISALTK